ncbi:pre-mRNA-splicing factor 18 [Daktulosphaira vitifoliae]|uniref:pre-mRNA-splicing factor 18 n=1 Tax=Daktulosphaira vitifoliae TaxID=58002 RepID=UPI0021A98B16|nr:pre-mRNA-splicing factor 18 [Daktulosphaira vitifoliae]
MDLLKAEIEKKRKQIEEANLVNDGRKYFKRADLLSKEREEYLKKCSVKIEGLENPVENQTFGVGDQSSSTTSEKHTLSRKEVVRRLRERGEPIMLFGESELDSFKRLRKSELAEPESNKGFRNDFQEALEKVDQDYLDELMTNQTAEKSYSELESMEDAMKTYETIQSKAGILGRRRDRTQDMEIILQLLQLLLKMWEVQLNSRSVKEKASVKGKLALATYNQTQLYLKPLLRKLKNSSLPDDILDSLTLITKHMLEKDYLRASDAYLEMAIGNAPWPIGVTMVGIHARTGREKIFSKNVAHVLNDETQRKYIQALKRLMTKCQHFFPTDPSRCVEYAPDTK